MINWFILGNFIDSIMLILTGVLLCKVIYLLGKYQAFDQNPQFDKAWWILHFKLRGSKSSLSHEPQNPNNANHRDTEHED